MDKKSYTVEYTQNADTCFYIDLVDKNNVKYIVKVGKEEDRTLPELLVLFDKQLKNT